MGRYVDIALKQTWVVAQDWEPWESSKTSSPCTACPQALFLLPLPCPLLSAPALFVLSPEFLSSPSPPPSLSPVHHIGLYRALSMQGRPALPGHPSSPGPPQTHVSILHLAPPPLSSFTCSSFLPHCSSHTKLLAVGQTGYASSCPWDFAYAVPFIWNTLPHLPNPGLPSIKYLPLTKFLRGGFHSPSLTVTSPGPDDNLADRSGHKGSEGPLSQLSRLSFLQADSISYLLLSPLSTIESAIEHPRFRIPETACRPQLLRNP